MGKLPIGTFQDIEASQIKAFLRENKEVAGLKKYTRAIVQMIASDEDKPGLERNEFEGLRGYIEYLAKLHRYISQSFGKNIPLPLLAKLIGANTDEELVNFFGNADVRLMLTVCKEKYLHIVIGLCSNLQEFESLSKNDNIRYVLGFGTDLSLIHLAIGLCSTPQELESLCDNESFRQFVGYSNEDFMELAVKLCSTHQELVWLCENENFQMIAQDASQYGVSESFWQISSLLATQANHMQSFNFLQKKIFSSKP